MFEYRHMRIHETIIHIALLISEQCVRIGQLEFYFVLVFGR